MLTRLVGSWLFWFHSTPFMPDLNSVSIVSLVLTEADLPAQ